MVRGTIDGESSFNGNMSVSLFVGGVMIQLNDNSVLSPTNVDNVVAS